MASLSKEKKHNCWFTFGHSIFHSSNTFSFTTKIKITLNSDIFYIDIAPLFPMKKKTRENICLRIIEIDNICSKNVEKFKTMCLVDLYKIGAFDFLALIYFFHFFFIAFHSIEKQKC